MANEHGRIPFASFMLGLTDSGAASSATVNSAYTWNTSGDAWYARFVSPVDQTNGALTLYIFVTNVPNNTSLGITMREAPPEGSSDDPDLPRKTGAATVGTPGSDLNLTNADDDTWVSLSMTALTLVANQCYYIIVENKDADPVTNPVDIAYRGALDGAMGVAATFMQCGLTTDGFATDVNTVESSSTTGPCIIKFDDGSVMGNPYVVWVSRSADANDRGIRIQFNEDVVIGGIYVRDATSTAATGWEIHKASDGSLVTSEGLDLYSETRAKGVRFAPVTLTGATAYDIVLTVGAVNAVPSGVLYMGEAEGSLPADVLACRPLGLAQVNGSTDPTATAYTVDNSKAIVFAIMLMDNPAIAGGGGGTTVPQSLHPIEAGITA